MFVTNLKKIFISITMLALFTSCEDGMHDDHDHDHDHDGHTDADGLVLESNGTEVYKELEGEVSVSNISLAAGETLELSVHFLDHEGNEIEHDDDDEDDDGGLTFTISDSSIISAEAEVHDDDADSDHGHHELAFELTGLSAGTTTFTVALMHEGHADYTSLDISVTVE